MGKIKDKSTNLLLLFLMISIPLLSLMSIILVNGESLGPTRTDERVIVLKGNIVTMNDQREVIQAGKVVVEGEKIAEVLTSSQSVPPEYLGSDYTEIDTSGYIYPGLINIHSHPLYNMLPIWNVPDSYTNRYQWTNEPEYKPEVSYPKQLLTGSEYHLTAEVAKYAEVKELVGGGVAIQGIGAVNSKYSNILIHNVEMSNYGEDYIYQNVASVDGFDEEYYLERYEDGRMKAFFVHLCEGIDTKSSNEFDTLKEKGLLNDATVIIHGAGMETSDFQDLAAAEGHMVWSPLSNLLLYGETADVVTAHQKGVEISLGPDWSPSGSKNVLNELKYADMLNRYEYDSYFSYQDLVEMVTVNPAHACAWQDNCGSIEIDKYAEIMVVHNTTGTDPYRTLVEATEKDIELVLVQGDPLYGDVALMEELKGDDMEVIVSDEGFQKAVDTTKDGVEFGNQRLSEIIDTLKDSMQFDKDFESDKYDVMHPIELDPLFTCDDEVFFKSIRNARNMDVEFDIEKEYYWWRGNYSYTNGGNVQPKIDDKLKIQSHEITPEPVMDGNDVFIEVRIASNYTVSKVMVDYRLSAGPIVNRELTFVDGSYSVSLGSFPGGKEMVYSITAVSALGNSVTSPDYNLTILEGSSDDDNPDDDDDGIDEGNGSDGGLVESNLLILIIVMVIILAVMVIVFVIFVKKRKNGDSDYPDDDNNE